MWLEDALPSLHFACAAEGVDEPFSRTHHANASTPNMVAASHASGRLSSAAQTPVPASCTERASLGPFRLGSRTVGTRRSS